MWKRIFTNKNIAVGIYWKI